MKAIRKRICASEKGIALIVTLGILTIVTLLVLAFAISMRVENIASKNFNDSIKARQMAQGAVDELVAILRDYTPPVTGPNQTYITAPGYAAKRTVTGWVETNLYPVATSADTNSMNSSGFIAGPALGTPNIFTQWKNVVVGGQLIGRYTYFVDDEAAKVNYSTAADRGNDLEGRKVGAVDLIALSNTTAAIVGDITNDVASSGPFDTPASAKSVSSVTEDIYQNNRFYTTVYSSDLDITPWGTKRLNLSNVVYNSTVYPDKASQIAAISNALDNANLKAWFTSTPYPSGTTFADKYPNLQQIGANIIDYIDIDSNCTDSAGWDDVNPPSYLGLERTPYINEIVISNAFVMSDPTGTVPVNRQIVLNNFTSFELWYMYTNGWTAPSDAEILILNRPSITFNPSGNVSASPAQWVPASPATLSSVASMLFTGGPNNFVTNNLILNDGSATFSITGLPTTIIFNPGTITAIFRSPGGRIQYITSYMESNSWTTTDAASQPPGTYYRGWATDANDPRSVPVVVFTNVTWSAGVGSLGNPNGPLNRQVITTNSTTPTIGIRADGDRTAHSLELGDHRDRGSMDPSEMSYIHAGLPWRTFWLQPQFPTESNSIPDWAALDLFTSIDSTNVAGRMNINGHLDYGTFLSALPYRTTPFDALLTNNVSGSRYVQGRAITNLYNHVFVNNYFAMLNPSYPTMRGQVCEILGVATNGLESSGSNNRVKAPSETAVRGIANLITTRSNAFTIWIVSQTIKEVGAPNGVFDGNDLVTAEVKAQAVVERTQNPGTDNNLLTSDDTTSFRLPYFRYITD